MGNVLPNVLDMLGAFTRDTDLLPIHTFIIPAIRVITRKTFIRYDRIQYGNA